MPFLQRKPGKYEYLGYVPS
uniref:Uncharacterized protein n=1 Tax=Arundo donax TaxID=35708 RepID=A0A0A9BTX0_ARUDO